MIPPEIDGWLRELRDYLPHNDTGYPSTDIREKDKGNLMMLACWFHCLDMMTTLSRGMAQSLRKEDQVVGSLLHYLVEPGVGFLTSTKVIHRVLWENEMDTQKQLKEVKDNLKEAELRLSPIKEEVKAAEKQLKKLNRSQESHIQDKQHAQRKCECLNTELREKEEFIKQCKYEIAYCQHYLAWQPLGEAPE